MIVLFWVFGIFGMIVEEFFFVDMLSLDDSRAVFFPSL